MKEAPFIKRLTPLRRLLWMYQLTVGRAFILKTVTGALLHVTDALAKPAKKLTATLEPTKVTGKNLFNKNDFVRNEGYINPTGNDYRTAEGRVTAVLPDPIPVGTYTISRATSARLRVGLVTSTTLTNMQPVIDKVSGTNDSDSPVTITVSQSGYYLAIFFKDTADADEQNLLDHLQVEVGSSATSYEDYTCTFTGHTAANVIRTGKNLLDPEKMTIYSGGYGRRWYENDGILLKGGQAYTFSVSGTSQTIRLYIINKSPTEDLISGTGTITYTPPKDVLVFLQAYRAEVIQDENNFQLEFGSTASDYEEYKDVTTTTITFPEDLTVYGGTLDVTNGLLKVYPYYNSYNGETLTGHWISNMDKYVVGTTPTIGAQVVNDGATPITHQITPTEINLLEGENYIWCDASDNLELSYHAAVE